MSEKKEIPSLNATQDLFDAAAAGKEESFDELTRIMIAARAANIVFTAEERKFFQDGLNKVVEHFDVKKLSEHQIRMLRASLALYFDGAILRDRYMALAKQDFPNYNDPAGLAECLGVRNSSVSLEEVTKRWQMLSQTKIGSLCFDKEINKGCIIAIDDTANEVQIQFERRRNVPVEAYFKDFIVVRDLSTLHSLLNGNQLPVHREGKDVHGELEGCLIHTGSLPANCLKRILVPSVMSENHFSTQVMGVISAPPAVKKAVPASGASAAAAVASVRWDESRSILELSERLKQVETLTVSGELQTKNVEEILKNAAPRAEQADSFALSFAYLEKMSGDLSSWLAELARSLSDTAVAWQDKAFCAEVSDKMPGKMVPYWFEAICDAKGAEYLASVTMKLPCKLWGNVEKLFARIGAKDLLPETVKNELASGHASADLLFWLWRSKLTDLKSKYLSDSSLLFKTLQQGAKGNYLKAITDLRRLLLDNKDFQILVMNNGDHQSVVELVHCVKRLPLLDIGEQQSLLVKISKLYPQYLSDIEEKRQGPLKMSVGRVTSIRGYKKRVAELKHLINELIPENVKAIEHARSLGDLRENSEFKYAKELQVILGKRRMEWEESLNGTRTTDFSDVKVGSVVVPGCTVLLRYADGHEESKHILGLLDSEPEKSIISYDAPLGKMLLGAEINSRFVMPSGDKVTLVAISKLSPELLDYVAGK